MKTIRNLLPVLGLFFFATPYWALAQVDAAKAGSAEALARIQAYKDRLAQSKPIDPTPGGVPASPSGTKKGIAAYDLYPEPWRSVFIEDWRKEIQAVKKATADDIERLRRTKNAAEAQKYSNYIRYYGERLATLERNDPPYFHPDAILAIIALGKNTMK
jgi:hypothetical protein